MKTKDTLKTVHKIAQEIKKCGGKAYFVGGCVRDKLLGKENKDIDIEVYGLTPSMLEVILSEFGTVIKCGVSFGIFNIKGLPVDFAVPRTERKTGEKHTDFTVDVDPYMDEASASKRRDFTINSIMENILTGEIFDYWGGAKDLTRKIIRHICSQTFIEDNLRVLRAAQFSARFGFDIASETMLLCQRLDLSALSRERVWGEMEKALLKSDKPSVFFEQLRRMNQLDIWFPEVKALIDTKQNQQYHREGDAWTHTMLVLDEAAKERDNAKQPTAFMVSALCHDFGKTVTTSTDDSGTVHSYRHETEGLPIVQRFVERLTSDKKLIKYVLNMTELHMQPNKKAEAKSKIKSTNKMFDKAAEPYDLILLADCDNKGRLPVSESSREFLISRLNLYNEMMSRPYVMGKDLVSDGLIPCEKFSEVLEYAHKLRLAGVEKSSALRQTLAYARKRGIKRNDGTKN